MAKAKRSAAGTDEARLKKKIQERRVAAEGARLEGGLRQLVKRLKRVQRKRRRLADRIRRATLQKAEAKEGTSEGA